MKKSGLFLTLLSLISASAFAQSQTMYQQRLITESEKGNFDEYETQRSDTLMLVSFKIYGKIDHWKELADINKPILKGSIKLVPGMKLKYKRPARLFDWHPEGSPYLIKRNDTLGLISYKVYETPKRWREIWNNNKPLIKNPDRVYAGFTIYYIEAQPNVADKPAEDLDNSVSLK